MQRGLLSFTPTEVILTHKRKVKKHKAKLSVSNFFEYVKITSVGLKLDRPQLEHWLLFLEHSRSGSEDSNVVAGLPVRMGYDCVYDLVCDSSSPFDFE